MKRMAAICGHLTMAFAMMIAAEPAAAQHIINLSSGGAEQTYTGPAGSRAGTWLDHGNIAGGDTRRDLVVGAPGGATGRVYVIFGRPPGSSAPLETYADAIVTGPASFGQATAIGNVTMENGSPLRNLVVAAPDAADGKGVVYIFTRQFEGGDRLTSSSAVATITGAPNDRLGAALATADLDDDGYRELIIGAPGTDRVYVLYGGPGFASRDLAAGADSVIVGHPANNSAIGTTLLAGPLTSDAIYDLVIGEPAANSVYLIGGAAGAALPTRIDLPATAADPSQRPLGVTSQFIGRDAGDEAGTTLTAADLDGNGAIDLLIGAPGADGPDNTALNMGEVYVLWNEQTSTSRSLSAPGVIFYGGQANQRLGSLVAKGDINRDTPNDLVFRLHYGSGGEARVYYGRNRNQIGQLSGNTRVVNFGQLNQENRIIINDQTGSLFSSLFVFEFTGEGARDVVIGDPMAASGAGQVLVVISPRMISSHPSVNVAVGEGRSVSTEVTVLNQSPITLQWTVAAVGSSSWLSVSPAQGASNHTTQGTFNVQTNASGLEPGVYAASIHLTSASVDLTMTRTIPVQLTVQQSRYLTMETPVNGATVEPPFSVSGAAFDTGSSSGTGVDRVDVYAVPAGGGSRVHLGTATYGQARPDISAAHGSRFANSGFTLQVESAPGGVFKLVAEARSTADATLWNKAATAPTVTIVGTRSTGDMNGDGYVDLVWQNAGNRAIAYWSMNNINMVAGGSLGSLPSGAWEVRTVADLNADGKPDLVLQEMRTGALTVWLMNGTTLLEARPLQSLSDPEWTVMAAGDFNGDDKTDLIFQHMTQGSVAAWLMNGTTLQQAVLLNPSRVSDLNWKIIGAGDVNGDGQADLVWQNERTRVLTSWLMNGTTMTSAGPFSVAGPSDTNWQARGIADINGDGKVDMLWQHVTEGYVAAWILDGRTFVEARLLNPNRVNLGWKLAGPR